MIPLGSTYRLQLNGIGFRGAQRLVPFLTDLGVETLYVSPIGSARSGSTHGYDVVDPACLDPALGTRDDLEALLAALADNSMRLLVDIVPNHMAATPANPFFADVLRRGRRSRYAAYFDIAWEEAAGTVVLPVLDAPLPLLLEAGRVRISRAEGATGYDLGYGDLRFPIDPADDEVILAELAAARDLRPPAVRRLLELVLAHQHYRLVEWRRAGRSVNYRRFFDINDLIGVRQEDPEVFAATHRLALALAADPRVAGLRVDHVDGVRDPAGYLTALRAAAPKAILVEKILDRTEPMPDWPVEGTTGYEFAAAVTGLFVDPRGASELAAVGRAATGDARSFESRAQDAKRAALDVLFRGALDHVVQRFARVPRLASVALDHLAPAIAELTVRLEVYRTYRRPGVAATRDDADRIDVAANSARATLGTQAAAALDGVVAVLRGALAVGAPEWDAVAAWQQLTPAVTAKGVEDTALYQPGTLLAAADVGFDPDHPARSAADFHAFLADRGEHWPGALNALSTHDSKRSHDVRCRLAVLSELPTQWETAVADIEAAHVPHPSDSPDAADRRFTYETLVGAWPVAGEPDADFDARVHRYLVKAAREAKRRSDWLDPDEGYERSLCAFAEGLLRAGTAGRRIIAGVVRDIEHAAATNSLASVVLRAAAPGVPDVYQHDERWFLALVDPDNRAPLGITSRSAFRRAPPAELLDDWRDGRIKQYAVREALSLRRRSPALFAEGAYREIAVRGTHAANLVAFARTHGDEAVVCVVPRLTQSLAGPGRFPLGASVWGDTAVDLSTLPVQRWTDALTGRRAGGPSMAAADLLAVLPVALLVGIS